MIIGLIGLGEMGAEIGRYFVKNGIEVLSVYDKRSKISLERATNYGIKDAGSIENFGQKSNIVFSIIPPDRSLETANEYSKFMKKDRNKIYCDLNAVSPKTASKIKDIIDKRNIEYVDGSIMGGPPNDNYSPRTYLSGKNAAELNFLSGKGIDIKILGESPYRASAMKMVYASITKGQKALVAAALIVAKKNNVYEDLMEELNFSEEYFYDSANKSIPSITHKAYRWIGEMHEISSTFKEAGLSGGIHEEAALVYELIEKVPNEKLTIDEIIEKITDKI